MRKNIYKIGLALIACGLILLFINPIAFIFGLLICTIGLITILCSKKTWKVKILTTVVSLILVLAIAVISMIFSFGAKAYEEFYISDKLNGDIRILYDLKSGQTPQNNNDWQKIYVDSTLTIIKRKTRRVFTKQRFYIIDQNGNFKELKKIEETNEYNGEPSVVVKNVGYLKDLDVNTLDLLVINDPKNLNHINSIDSVSRHLLNLCRQKN